LVGLQNDFYPRESCCLRIGHFVWILDLEGTAGLLRNACNTSSR